MSILSWLFGGSGDRPRGRYTDEQARTNGIIGAAWDNATSAGLTDPRDTRGSSHAVEERYRRDGIERDYFGGQRPGQHYDSWGNPVDEHGKYQGE